MDQTITQLRQFVDALKNSIINGLLYEGMHNANCEGDDTELMATLHNTYSNLSRSDASVAVVCGFLKHP